MSDLLNNPLASDEFDQYKINKIIPKVLENEILKALSFYPELKETHIDFVFKKNIKRSVMQAQPKVLSVFGKHRAYNINISALFRLKTSAIPIHQLPSNIIIGWIGHELGHIMDYENRNMPGMIRFGVGYLLSSKYVREAERTADTYAVNHGLGKYILETKHFILNNANLSEKYKQKIARLYLSPDDIMEQVLKLETGQNGKSL
ncbi:hypothetical protein [Dyadobacter sediminis]|uniref:Uncharacterized protein n=1 Tax=Dyadobacter sediminis TaxID=1493691 RepID=A0A5R9K6X4_9BACT|nr:hypothetical protein [Dyadobacter sediminis]TLU89545.1 hypothetical protein FEM55_22670 [Dyadobacter sediminis]GGC04426.1 hypothetical protein GCM10011325_34250 [Dyadobacter sediminis]